MVDELRAFLASPVLGLFLIFIFCALQFTGVISVNLARLLLFMAWLIAVAGTCASLNNAPLKHLAITAAVTGVPLGFALFLLERWIARTVKRREGAPPIKEPLGEKQPAPNIVCLGEDGLFCVELDRHQVFRESNYDDAGALRPAVAVFTNVPKPPDRVGSVANVAAQIVFYDAKWPEREAYRVNHACWLNEESPYVSFNLDTIHQVIVGVFQHKKDGTDGFEPDFIIYGNSPDRNVPLSKYSDRFTESFKIKIRLIVGEYGEFSSEHDFELQHTSGQAFSFGYISEEEKRKRKEYVNDELVKLIVKGEQLVTIPLINPGWDKLYQDIHNWMAEVSGLLERNLGTPLLIRFSSNAKLVPYPHKISEGRQRFFDELYTRIENLKEIGRDLGADVPALDISKQIKEVTEKRRKKIVEDLTRFAARVSVLFEHTKIKRLSMHERDLYVWDADIFDYLDTNLDRTDAALICDTSLEEYAPAEEIPMGCQNFLNRVHSRLVRLNHLIDEIQSGHRAV